ncbi:MAG: molecular chaperone DnaK [Candidatus Aminicenantales bacterium]
MSHVVGIDLGTTYSCVAYLEGERPRVIPNLEGQTTTPSVVSFTSSGERLVGNLALRQAVTNPEKTVYAIKRLIGRKFNSPQVQEARQRMPYQLSEAPNGDVRVVVDSLDISPQEISGMVLGYLKTCAESFLGEPVEQAVITVPAHFDDPQRQATKDAAKIAGLEVLRVINEPTAASLAYGLEARKNARIAVFDLGGGTFDITILEIQDTVFQVLATCGDSYLGGEDFDNRIVEWLIEDFRQEHQVDLFQDKFALQRIKEAAEKAKRELSFVQESEINLPFICLTPTGSKHITKKLTRGMLETLTRDLVQKTIPLIERALADSRMKPEDIEEVILVGGQTRMPLVRKTIADYFKKTPREDINPDEIVAMGAAIQSGILSQERKADLVVLLDVTSHSLGIETENDTYQQIIERNATIPTRKTMPFTTVEDNQVKVTIHVLQGENPQASRNRSLARFDLIGLPPAPAGVPQIDVTFEIDANGILKVSARDVQTGLSQQIQIRPSSGLSANEIDAIIQRNQALPGKSQS